MQQDRTTDPVRIELRRRNGDLAGVVLLDPEDAHLGDLAWTVNAKGYAVRSVYAGTTNGKHHYDSVFMHRVIMGLTKGDGLQVDHINRNPLDNRRENLRVCTSAQNRQNVDRGHGTSRFRGVSFDKQNRSAPWRAQAGLGGKKHWLGNFSTEEEAAEAAAAFRREHMPFATN